MRLVPTLGEGTAPLTDVDGIGLMCDPCLGREKPPHDAYLRELFRTKFPIACDGYVLLNIAMYAYPDFEESVRATAMFCSKRP